MSAPVCRYYMNGTCRFGDRCRFSHDIPESNYSNSSYTSHNPYVLNRNQPSDHHNYNEPKQNWRQNVSYNDILEIVEKIREEAKQVEYEKMWPLTCLSILKEASNVPGWEDYSMEELRVAAYSSKKAGRFDEYVRFYSSLLQKAKEARSIFFSPGKRAEEVVRSMFEKRAQSDKPSSAGNFSFAQIPAFSGFSSSAPSGPSGVGSIFGGSAAPKPSSPFGSSPFGSGTSDPAPGLFAMAAQGFTSNESQGSVLNDTDMETATESLLNQSSTSGVSAFQQNIFGQVVQSGGFGSTSSTAGSVFGGNAVTPSVFGGSPAKPGDGNTASSSVFGSASAAGSVFGGTPSSSSVFGNAPTANSVLNSLFGSAESTVSSSPGVESPDSEMKRPLRRHETPKRCNSSSNRSWSRSCSQSTSQSKSRSRSRSRSRSERKSRDRSRNRIQPRDRSRNRTQPRGRSESGSRDRPRRPESSESSHARRSGKRSDDERKWYRYSSRNRNYTSDYEYRKPRRR